VSRLIPIQRTRRQHIKQLADFTHSLPHRSTELVADIQASTDPAQLAQLWQERLEPLLRRTFRMLQVGTSRYENAYRPLQRQLRRQIGPDKAITLLSGVSDDGDRLDSLGPLVGLWQVKTGELSRKAYLQRYGHRSPHEMEVSIPRPVEAPGWLDEQLTTLDNVDVPALLTQQEAKKEKVWQEYAGQFPRQAKKMKQKLVKAAQLARGREAIRSEMTRLVSVGRDFALRAGELTGLGDGVFFLSADELLAVLRGETDTTVAHIPARRQTYEAYRSLPPCPTIINGRFDPFQWAQDPNRRSDLFDAHQDPEDGASLAGQHTITGYPGSPGIVEGVVRRLDSMDKANQFRPGEILVTNTTNVGWTPLFPRAAAVVTDVGAPLSHAAIVARELGIPAVVGCNNATMHLHSGDRVRVNGGLGLVELLDAEERG
jgi:pyruvate,water dikinase